MKRAGLALLLWALMAGPALAQADPLSGVGLDQRLGAIVPGGLAFTDEGGRRIRLDELGEARPVVLALVYYRCPNVCSGTLNSLMSRLMQIKASAGSDYQAIIVSIDPAETTELAASRKRHYLRLYGRAGGEAGLHFLTGERVEIEALARAVGVRYRYDPATKQYAHPAGVVVLTPQRAVSRYVLALDAAPDALAEAIAQAGAGRVGHPVLDLVLRCFHYDLTTSPVGPWVQRALQVAGLAMVLALAGLIGWLARGERRQVRR